LPPTIDLVFFDAGGGHRAAATALESVIAAQGRPWRTRLVNLQELLDSIDVLRKLTGMRMQDGYNLLLRKGWTLGSAGMLRNLHALIRLYHPRQVRMLAAHWRADPPDMVVSLIPNFNRAMFEALRSLRPGALYMTILTDFCDYPPHFWIEAQDQYVVCGTRRAAEQAREIGVSPQRILRVSGMILRPQFYEPFRGDRAAERRRLGLDPDVPAGLLLFGGHGSAVMAAIAERLQQAPSAVQLIAICGRNETLARRLRAMRSRFPIHVEGFTAEVPYFMWLADFFIGKPGPGSISEAVAMNLPVIVERNAWTLPQERFNADWVLEKGVGVVVPSFRQIVPAVERLLASGMLERCRAAAAAIENRAVFEIPDLLARVLDGRS
jgi:1,2-diacylglycerol 3-beta-galactosyltransferase